MSLGRFGLQQDPPAADGFPFFACELWFGMEPRPLGWRSPGSLVFFEG